MDSQTQPELTQILDPKYGQPEQTQNGLDWGEFKLEKNWSSRAQKTALVEGEGAHQ